MTTDRYPCLVPPGTVTPKLTGQKHPPPESDIRTARTGILSSLLFSRSQKGYGTHPDQDIHPNQTVGATLFQKQTPPWSEELRYGHREVRATCRKELWGTAAQSALLQRENLGLVPPHGVPRLPCGGASVGSLRLTTAPRHHQI